MSETGVEIEENPQVEIDPNDLRRLRNKLWEQEGSRIRMRSLVGDFARTQGVTREQVLSAVRTYALQEMKTREKGPIYHYHQLPLKVLTDVVNDRALLSFDRQKEMGRAVNATGSRPDVVQMTRDRYDSNGKLISLGLGTAGVGGNLVFVFKPTIMDLPYYDCVSEYPNLPTIPLKPTLLETILVERVEDKKPMTERLSSLGTVKTQSEWIQEQTHAVSGGR